MILHNDGTSTAALLWNTFTTIVIRCSHLDFRSTISTVFTLSGKGMISSTGASDWLGGTRTPLI
jgi:hypothetical protein